MSLAKYQADVAAFRVALELPIGNLLAPGFVDNKEADLAASIINEEVGETTKAIGDRDPLETIDGLCDALYVTLGCAVSIGFDLAAVISVEPTTSPDVYLFARGEDVSRFLWGAARVTCYAIQERDTFGVCAGLLSLTTVILHTAAAWGIPLRPFWDEVQRANMAKVGGPRRADGKRLKPPGWTPPDHRPTLLALTSGTGVIPWAS